MSAAPDLGQRLAELEAENRRLRGQVARVGALADEWAFSQGDLGNDSFSIRAASVAIRAALADDLPTPPADRLCDCTGDAANICPSCRPRRFE